MVGKWLKNNFLQRVFGNPTAWSVFHLAKGKKLIQRGRRHIDLSEKFAKEAEKQGYK